jgi:hypothetical protein
MVEDYEGRERKKMEETGEDVQGWSLRDSKKTGRKSPWSVAVCCKFPFRNHCLLIISMEEEIHGIVIDFKTGL